MLSKSQLNRLWRQRAADPCRRCCRPERSLSSSIQDPIAARLPLHYNHERQQPSLRGPLSVALSSSPSSLSLCGSLSSRRFSSSAAVVPSEPKPILQHAADQEEQLALQQQQQQQQPTTKQSDDNYQKYSLDVLRQLDMDPDALNALASQHPTPLSLADMYKYASGHVSQDQRLYNAQFLHKELAIRLAQRAVDLLTLPLGLSEAEPIRQVARLYLHYIKQLQDVPRPTTRAEEDKFTLLLQSLMLDRSTIPTQIAKGVWEWNQDSLQRRTEASNDESATVSSPDDDDQYNAQERQDVLEEALYRFFTARVGLRFLIEHHVVSSTASGLDYRKLLASVLPKGSRREEAKTDKAGVPTLDEDSIQDAAAISAGCIQSNVNVVKETRMVAQLVKEQTMQAYGCCPEINIVDCIIPKEQQEQDVDGSALRNRQFTYVPHHLHYMLAELLMNSCRATVRLYQAGKMSTAAVNSRSISATTAGDSGDTEQAPVMLPIRVVLVMGKEDITIKVCDKGGGIPRSLMSKIWKFGHSTDTAEDVIVSLSSGNETEEVAGAHLRGFGLPLARIYARYFGGELSLKSLEGHGVDAYLHLPRLGEACEHLPLRVRSSPGELDSMPKGYRQSNGIKGTRL